MLQKDILGDLREASAKERTELLDKCIEQYGIIETVESLAQNCSRERQLIASAITKSSLFKMQKQDMKTIGMFYHRFYNGGTENVMALLVDVFGDMGYRVVIFTDDEPNDFDYQTKYSYARVVLPPHGESNSNYRSRGEVLLNALQEHSIDCFIWHAWMSDLTLWDMLVIKSEGISFITYAHGCFAFPAMTADWLYHYDMPSVFSLMDAVVVLSRVDRAYWSVFNENVHWLNQPFRTNLLREETESPSGTELVWVGRLSYEKNPLALIKIMNKVREKIPAARLTIIGKAETLKEQELFENAIAEEGLSKVIRLVGFKQDIDPYFRDATLLLSTSLIEGFPLTLTEAKGFGVPCIMFDLPFLETVRTGKGIVTVPFDDSDEFAKQLVELMQSDEKRAELSRAAKRSLVDYLASQDVAKDWDNVFKSLFDINYCQVLEIDDEPEKTNRILWHTNNHYTEIGLHNYINRRDGVKQHYEASHSYRIGRAITYLPRKVKSMLSR